MDKVNKVPFPTSSGSLRPEGFALRWQLGNMSPRGHKPFQHGHISQENGGYVFHVTWEICGQIEGSDPYVTVSDPRMVDAGKNGENRRRKKKRV